MSLKFYGSKKNRMQKKWWLAPQIRMMQFKLPIEPTTWLASTKASFLKSIPTTCSFHLLQSVYSFCKPDFATGCTDASKAAIDFQIDLFRWDVRIGIVQKQSRQTH